VGRVRVPAVSSFASRILLWINPLSNLGGLSYIRAFTKTFGGTRTRVSACYAPRRGQPPSDQREGAPVRLPVPVVLAGEFQRPAFSRAESGEGGR